jgi:predicted RNase H-like HicB family nuclease
MWSIVFPDFPGVTSAASELADVPQQARDALATAIQDMTAEREDLPPSVEEGQLTEPDRSGLHDPRYIVVPVEVADNPTRINVRLDRGLLKRIDDAAGHDPLAISRRGRAKAAACAGRLGRAGSLSPETGAWISPNGCVVSGSLNTSGPSVRTRLTRG